MEVTMDGRRTARNSRKPFFVRRVITFLTSFLLVTFVCSSVGVSASLRRPQQLPHYISQVGAHLDIERVSQPGFDAEGWERLADSAWSMRYFEADGANIGYLYVGTDNNILGLTLAILREHKHEALRPVQPPQIRRYRPDLGPETWEVVLDYADHEEPPYLNEGFRSMGVYRAKVDGRAYLYAGTMAAREPEVWRSASGDPGSWEKVLTFPDEPGRRFGSVRALVSHADGLLYMAVTPSGDIISGTLGEIWATDGLDFTPVITDGFGNLDNIGISTLASFNGCLYAGTYNPNGYEIWKLRCVSEPYAPPKPVVQGGTGYRHSEVALSMEAFRDHLYVGTGIPLGFNPLTKHGPRGCDLIRVNPDDSWQVIVGPKRSQPLSGYRAGFGWYLNAYCWYIQEHEGQLYLGTWDISRTIDFLGTGTENLVRPFKPLVNVLSPRPQGWGSPMGGDLYRTTDGVHWEPVFLDGVGNPDNHGVRTLESTPMGLFIGTENPFTRLEIWLLRAG
jgi:hypothetical protein